MMDDVVDCEKYLKYLDNDQWTDFCKYFCKKIQTYGNIDEKLHYFRNKLNRAPETIYKLLIESKNAKTDNETHRFTERMLKEGLHYENNKDIYSCLLFFLGEAILAIIHFYYGISSLLKVLYDNFRLKLYYTMFWDYDKSTYKNWDYMDKVELSRNVQSENTQNLG